MDGETLKLQEDKLVDILKTVKVFARVSPEQKLKIVNCVKELDNIVAVTGDGVNDAPAIKSANIGISMGISGTDVTKEVSDMILKDDNYKTIVEAIKQGRIVFDNFIKFISYLISCNISEILVITIATFLGYPLPLLPIHILWINLVTDGFPALSLGMEPGEKDIMKRAPRKSNEIITEATWVTISIQACTIALASFVVFILSYISFDLITAQTATMTTLAFAQLFNALNNKSIKNSVFSRKLRNNYSLYATIVFTGLLQLALIYTPFLNTIMKTTPLTPQMLLTALVVASSVLFSTEVYKFIRYKLK
jgi:Ca2+-transporting ATPase